MFFEPLTTEAENEGHDCLYATVQVAKSWCCMNRNIQVSREKNQCLRPHGRSDHSENQTYQYERLNARNENKEVAFFDDEDTKPAESVDVKVANKRQIGGGWLPMLDDYQGRKKRNRELLLLIIMTTYC
ncbi:uncharacterized protein LOC119302417 isoform X2 [Triticum dicoccoides]|uniref:uncharacterized protein LOC119302417 isoform X2 n=1 Tax=Triticum dicoccoides TaxID=85692 RepID=UPI00188E09E9|nr:uncharacterized protein LOC119302417 isoform X2 [Triticum dicoccoides]XP_044380426.1 uncharacterized protein LOC123103006 isoform X2 [Triticum aestivum]